MADVFFSEPFVDIYFGHALPILKSLPDELAQMCMTSPPYWGLRNYASGADIVWGDNHCDHQWLEETHEHQIRTGLGLEELGKQYRGGGHKAKEAGQPTTVTQSFCLKCGAWRGQLGLEPTPELYVEHLMIIFREVKRVLRKDGSFYLNIADTYAGLGCGAHDYRDETSTGILRKRQRDIYQNKPVPQLNLGIPAKCMVCIPERVLFAMLDDGWILRNKLIWHKPNSMPSSVKDRFTQTWEYLYFFVKSRKYYFNLDAVRIPHKVQSLERYQRQVNFDNSGKSPRNKYIGEEVYPKGQQIYRGGRNLAPEWFQGMFPPDEDYEGKFDDLFGHGSNPQSFNLRVRDVKRGKKGTSAQSGELKASEQEIQDYEYPKKHHGSLMTNQESLHNDRAFQSQKEPYLKNNPHTMRLHLENHIALDPEHPLDLSHPKGKNPGDILTPRQEEIISHFEEKGSGGHYLYGGLESPEGVHQHPKGKNPGDTMADPGDFWELTTQPSSIAVCPSCLSVFPRLIKICPKCGAEGITGHFAPFPEKLCVTPILASSRPGDVVVDPFAGTGTVGVVAKKLGRKAILIDCVKTYCAMSKYRTNKVVCQPEIKLT